MKRRLNKALMVAWKWQVGGPKEAAERIEKCLRCSPSKAEKLADGRYPSELSPLEADALAAMIEVSVDDLYLVVGKTRDKAS
jgi:hypothetical protein